MKFSVSKILPFFFVIYSFGALSQSFVDNSYGFLDPKIIYNQANYFNKARLGELKTTNDLPTPKEVAHLKDMLAQTKNAARTEAFGKKVLPMTAMTVAYPLISAAVFMISYTVTLGISYCTTRVTPGGVSMWSPMVSGLTLSGAFNMIMGDPGLVDTLQHLQGGKPPTDALMDLEASYVGHKHLIPTALQERAEEMLFSTRLGGTPATTTKSYLTTLIAVQKAQTRSCPITKSWEEIERDISKGLSRYSEELRDQVLNLAHTYYTNIKKGDSSFSRLVAYLNGVPGVGKSRLAKIIAEAFGVRAVTMSLAGLSPKDLWGSDGTTPGIIITKYAELGCNSGFMTFEDVDHAITDGMYAQSLAASLLDLFDTTQLSIWSNFLQTKVNTSKIFMIATGNSDLGKEALSDRANLVYFPDFTKAVKQEIIFEEYLPSRLLDLQIASRDFEPEMEALKQEIANDKHPGLRTDHHLVEKALAKFGRERARNASKK